MSKLKDFYKQKSPQNNFEKNTVFVFFLGKLAGVAGITLSHIYTCYKFAGEKVPGALKQSLIDTASRKGWIDTGSLDDIRLTIIGENFVEHDLATAKEAVTK